MQQNATARIQVRLLGKYDMAPFLSQSAMGRQLLALIVLAKLLPDFPTSGEVSRDWLAQNLYAERYANDRDQARNNLGYVVGILKSSLGNRLDVAKDYLTTQNVSTDIDDFYSALAQRDFQKGVNLWRGPLLQGWVYDWQQHEWYQDIRIELDRSYLDALYQLANREASKRIEARIVSYSPEQVEEYRQTALTLLSRAMEYVNTAYPLPQVIDSVSSVLENIKRLHNDLQIVVSDSPISSAEVPLDKMKHKLEGSLAVSDWLAIPQREWKGTPGALLRADHAIVPFHGREQELDDLRRWVFGDESTARLITGSGGMGKSRMARELCLQMRAEGVRSGFLDSNAMDACVADLQSHQRTLLVIDYAETREEQVAQILAVAFKANLSSLRLLLLSRGAGHWWRRLRRSADPSGAWLGEEPQRLRSLTSDLVGRLESYCLARSAFSEKLGQKTDINEPGGLDATYYERILVLHMSALLAVQGIEAHGIDPILERILDREAIYWSLQLKSRGLPQFLEDGFERAMGVISAYGGVSDKQEAINILSRIHFFADQPRAVIEAVADALHDCYPGPPWIEPIQPDLLMEFLIARATKDDPRDFNNIVL